MSYLDTYVSPKACYRKAPVRRETIEEQHERYVDQIPVTRLHRSIVRMCEKDRSVSATINKDLVPGKAKFIKEVTNV